MCLRTRTRTDLVPPRRIETSVYYYFWAVVGGLIYLQMSAVAAVMYENHRVVTEGLTLTERQRQVALVKRTLWFMVLPVTGLLGLARAGRTSRA